MNQVFPEPAWARGLALQAGQLVCADLPEAAPKIQRAILAGLHFRGTLARLGVEDRIR
jgi:hypothetical protein